MIQYWSGPEVTSLIFHVGLCYRLCRRSGFGGIQYTSVCNHNQNAQVLCMDINVKPQPFTNEQIQQLPSLGAKYGTEKRPD